MCAAIMNADTDLPTVYPSFHYQDCRAAIDWLVGVLELTPHLVVPAPTAASITPN